MADAANHAIRKITSGGVVSTIAGTAGAAGAVNGTGPAARFRSPGALVLDKTYATLFVADTGNYTIRKIVLATNVVSTLSGSAGVPGTANGSATAARFGLVYGLGMDSSGNIYVSDFSASTIRKVLSTNGTVSAFAGATNTRGSTNGTLTASRFASPHALYVDASNNIYLSDYGNCTVRKITSTGTVSTPIGTAGANNCQFAPGVAPAKLNMVSGLVKVGSTLYFSAGNGVGIATAMP